MFLINKLNKKIIIISKLKNSNLKVEEKTHNIKNYNLNTLSNELLYLKIRIY